MTAEGCWKPCDLDTQVTAPAKSFSRLNVFKWSQYWGQPCAQLSSALEVTLQPARECVQLTRSIFSLPDIVTNIPSRGWACLRHSNEAARQPGLSSTRRPVGLNWEVCCFLEVAAQRHRESGIYPLPHTARSCLVSGTGQS